jgi:hypothetical protein
MPIEKNIIETPLSGEQLIKWMKELDANFEHDVQLEKESAASDQAELRRTMGEEAYHKYLKEEIEREKDAELDFEKRCMERTQQQ